MNSFLKIPDDPITVLIRPPISRWKLYKWYSYFGSHEPSLGLLYIASYVESNGYKVTILDGEILGFNKLLTELNKIKPDIIGVTSTTFSFFNAVDLLNAVHSTLPSSLLLMGGIHASVLPEDTLNKIPFLNGVVVGEGEETMLEIIKKCDTNEIDGLIWRRNLQYEVIKNKPRMSVVELDKYKLNWQLLDGFPQKYSPPFQTRKKNSVSLVISRGCNYDCSFCSSNFFSGRNIRYHTPEYVVNEMTELERNYQINDFYFHDDYLTANTKWIRKFCDIMIGSNKSLTWSCVSRAEPLSDELLNLMKKAGCRQIGIGIESASQEVLNKISKRTTVQKIKVVLKRILSAKIEIKAFFILDTPDASFKDLASTIKFILLQKFSEIQFNYYAPLPGSHDYLKYNPDSNIWAKMSLQHCLGYSKISGVFYRTVEILMYTVSYFKIFIIRITDSFLKLFIIKQQ